VSASSISLADYRAALTTRGAAGPALCSALGRLPIAMFSLATLLYVQRATGSFATAGLVSAGVLAGVSLGSVLQGRVLDRYGATRPLLVVVVLFVASVGGLVAAVEAGLVLAVVVAAALLSGLTSPALPGASRALWARLIPTGSRRDAAYSYEAISLEVFFILGPALAVFLVAAPWPGTGLAVATLAMATGTVGFALSRVVRTDRRALRAGRIAPGDVGGIGLLGAPAQPGIRTVALASLGFGLVIGAVEVGVPAVTATTFGSTTLGGVLLSAWSVTSVLAGVLYGMRPWPRPLHLRMPVLLGAFASLVLAMALVGPSGSLLVLALAMLAAGATITPQVTAHSIAVDRTAPAGTATEAFGWVITAATLGVAGGQSLGGVVVEAAGPPAAFVAGGVAGLVLAGALWLRRATLAPAPAPALTAP
jgi:MFS family permease